MAKKNSYKSLSLEDCKKEIGNNLDKLDKFDLDNLTDDIEFTATATGGVIPRVIASIENKMDAIIIVAKEAVEQLKLIKDLEGKSVFIEYALEQVKNKIADIKKYYEDNPTTLEDHRFYKIEKVSKKGTPFTLSVLCANAPTQIKSRSKIFKIILELTPLIDMLEDDSKKETLRKGGEDIPDSLKGLI